MCIRDRYREIYSNSVQVRVTVWDFLLVFGLVHQETAEQVDVKNALGVYLSPQQAKACLLYTSRSGWGRNLRRMGWRSERRASFCGRRAMDCENWVWAGVRWARD